MYWLKKLKVNARFNESLSAHTTLGVGGPADVWVQPRDWSELKEIVCNCVQKGIPYLVLGNGSNVLISDEGFKGVVISLKSPAFSKMKLVGNRISSGAGISLYNLINQTKKWGLGGLEFLAGIPASIAGALTMNAGNRHKYIGNMVESVTVMDKEGRIRVLKSKQLKFGYRKSNLDKYIVLEVVLKLRRRSTHRIQRAIVANLSQKKKTQDLISRSAGCVFKNPRHRLTAGEMIEACGLKKMRKRDAEISEKHANFIINRGEAKAKDILYLIDLAQKRVKKRFGVDLKTEIKMIGCTSVASAGLSRPFGLAEEKTTKRCRTATSPPTSKKKV